MRTRDVLRWNFSTGDCLYIAELALAGAVLVALDGAGAAIERWIDYRGSWWFLDGDA